MMLDTTKSNQQVQFGFSGPFGDVLQRNQTYFDKK